MPQTKSSRNPSDVPLGDRLRAWRTFRGLTQYDVESRAGLAHNALSRIEKGLVSPKLETLEKIASAMDLTIEELHLGMPAAAKNANMRQEHIARLNQLISVLPLEKQARVIEAICRLLEEVNA